MSFDGEGFGDDGEPRLEPEEEDEIGGIDVFAKDIDDDEDFSLEEILREREGEKDGIEDQQPIFSNPKKSNLTSDIADDMIGRGILGGAREERKVADFVGVMEYEDEENLLRTQSSVDNKFFPGANGKVGTTHLLTINLILSGMNLPQSIGIALASHFFFHHKTSDFSFDVANLGLLVLLVAVVIGFVGIARSGSREPNIMETSRNLFLIGMFSVILAQGFRFLLFADYWDRQQILVRDCGSFFVHFSSLCLDVMRYPATVSVSCFCFYLCWRMMDERLNFKGERRVTFRATPVHLWFIVAVYWHVDTSNYIGASLWGLCHHQSDVHKRSDTSTLFVVLWFVALLMKLLVVGTRMSRQKKKSLMFFSFVIDVVLGAFSLYHQQIYLDYFSPLPKVLENDLPKMLDQGIYISTAIYLCACLFFMFVFLIFALIEKEPYFDSEEFGEISSSSTVEWKTYLCDCFADMESCALVCLCPCILFGKLRKKMNPLESSFQSCMIYMCFMPFCGNCALGFLNRLQVRWSTDNENLSGSVLGDCFRHWLCCWCSLTQEYREFMRRPRQRKSDEKRKQKPSPKSMFEGAGDDIPIGEEDI